MTTISSLITQRQENKKNKTCKERWREQPDGRTSTIQFQKQRVSSVFLETKALFFLLIFLRSISPLFPKITWPFLRDSRIPSNEKEKKERKATSFHPYKDRIQQNKNNNITIKTHKKKTNNKTQKNRAKPPPLVQFWIKTKIRWKPVFHFHADSIERWPGIPFLLLPLLCLFYTEADREA